MGRQSDVSSTAVLNPEDLTVYKIDCSGVDEKPEVQFMCLKRLVGPRGRFSNFSADARRL
jgi:hypothetical protein